AVYRAWEQQGHVRFVRDRAGLDRHLAEWESWDRAADAEAGSSPPIGLVISMESADPILSPAQLSEWWDAGVRVIGPAHYGPGCYAGGTGTQDGLTPLGNELLVEMERLGIILDLTHLSDEAFWQAMEQYSGPVLASHNNCRALVPHQRQFDDAQLRAIIERDGVVGAVLDAWMLQPGWIVGRTTNERVSLANVVDHIDHICQLAGSSRHAAIGSDLDGGFGGEQSPRDLDTIADLQRIGHLLSERGYSGADVAGILHDNWLRTLRQAWRGESFQRRTPVRI
ncbi:MAG: membrane dipeptidase, partial [Chloroflexota bacterium]|nr:membrane dipeptidase [Chloroflexota bacterium]